MSAVPTSADLIVLGAGPAGLAAAWQARRAGLSTIVLERSHAVGGMAASFDVAGLRVDHGSHRLHPATPPAVLADLRALLGADLQCRPRNGRLRIAGEWIGFPLRPGELLRALPPAMLARLAAETLTAPLRGRRHPHRNRIPDADQLPDADQDRLQDADRDRLRDRLRDQDRLREPASYADALRTSLGPTLYDALYGPYAVKLWGLPGEQIDVEQARRRVSADTPGKIARRMLRQHLAGLAGPRRSSHQAGQGRIFYYPRRGFGQIVDALADAAVGAGAALHVDTEVDQIRPGEQDVTVRTRTGQTFTAGHLFTTIPLPMLARITTPAPPASAVEAAAALRFRSMVLIYLVHVGRPWTRFDAHYLPGPDTPISRISEPANYRESAADPADRTVLCCELPCQFGDRWWTADDAELAALVSDTLARAGLPPVRCVEVVVRRLRTVYPVYQSGYAEHLTGLDAWATDLPRVTTFGRLGLFVHDNSHHAIAMAYAAVDALRTGSWDAATWSAARHHFTTHVVED